MAKVSRSSRRVWVEAIEPRWMCDASQLTESVTAATFASVSSAATVSGKATVVVDSPGAAINDKVTVSVFASETPLSASSPAASTDNLGFVKPTLILAAGATKTYMIPIKVKAGGLPDGTYALYAVVTDLGGATSVSTAGPPLTVAAPFIALAPTESFVKLPTTAVAGSATTASAKISIANSGNSTSSGPTTVAVYITPDGLPADGTQVATLTRSIRIAAGKSAPVSFPLKNFPTGLAAGTYELVTQVTDQNGIATTSAAAGSIMITPPPPAGAFGADLTLVDATFRYNPAFNTDQSLSANFFELITLDVTFTNPSAMATTQNLTVDFYESQTAPVDTTGVPYDTTSYMVKLGPKATMKEKIVLPTVPHLGEAPGLAPFNFVATFTNSSDISVTSVAKPQLGLLF